MIIFGGFCYNRSPWMKKGANLTREDSSVQFQGTESMRKTILLQEQMFKHQVRELHRIYSLQKKLMDEKGLIQKRDPNITTNHQEMSSSCLGDQTSGMPIQFDLERRSQSAPSSIQHRDLKGIDDDENEVEVELTLSIGHCTRKKRSKQCVHDSDQVGEHSSSSMETSKGKECGDPSSNISSSSGYRDGKQPHWLLQDLSLNRT